jgi:anti-anti-sigma regulatory factor
MVNEGVMNQAQEKPFRLKTIQEGPALIFRAEGEIQDHHPKVLGVGFVKKISEGNLFLVLDIANAKGLNKQIIMQLIHIGREVQKKGGQLYLAGLNKETQQFVNRANIQDWVGVAKDADSAISKLKESLDSLSGRELLKYVESLREEVAKLDVEMGEQLKEQNDVLLERTEDLKILLISWKKALPKEGLLPLPKTFFKTEHALLQQLNKAGAVPRTVVGNMEETWSEIEDEV